MNELQMMKNSMSLILLLKIIPKNFNQIFWMQRDMKYSFMPHVNAKLHINREGILIATFYCPKMI